MYQDSACTAAYLSIRPKGSKHDPLNSLVQVGIIKYDQTALAAKLHRGWPQVGDGCLCNAFTRDRAASESYFGHGRMGTAGKRQQRRADFVSVTSIAGGQAESVDLVDWQSCCRRE